MSKALLLLLIPLLVSCSFVDEEDTEHDKEQHPDLILENTEYILGQSGESPVYIQSARIALWSGEDKAETGSLSFCQLDEDGEIAISGRAGHAVINTETKVLELSGDVVFQSMDGNMRIEAGSLVFDSDNEELSSEGNVSVSSDDGTFEGEGFHADLVNSAYTFSAITKGTIVL